LAAISTSRSSEIEYRPADLISQPLIIQDKIANRIRQLVALPEAFKPARTIPLAFRRICRYCRTHGLDRVGRGAQLVRGDVRYRRSLTGSIRGMARRSAQIPSRTHRMAGRRAGLGHRDLSAHPCPSLLNCVTWPGVFGLRLLEEVQDVLRTRGRPQSEKVMVCIRERPTSADGGEARVAIFGEDHGIMLYIS
jgi:hypothetical protein